jgi:hypothetical protein
MKPATVACLRVPTAVFVATAIAFALATTLFERSLGVGLPTWFGVAVRAALVGAVTALACGRLHEFAARRSSPAPYVDLAQSETLTLRVGVDDARAAARTAIVCVGAMPVERPHAGGVVLEGRTGCSWRSFGEVVRAEVTSARDGVTVRFSSRPRVGATQVDYGKNVENLWVMRASLAGAVGGLAARAGAAAA